MINKIFQQLVNELKIAKDKENLATEDLKKNPRPMNFWEEGKAIGYTDGISTAIEIVEKYLEREDGDDNNDDDDDGRCACGNEAMENSEYCEECI
jgi:hypothetical protein